MTCVKYRRAASCSIKNQHQGQDRDYVTFLESKIRHLENAISGTGSAPVHPSRDSQAEAPENLTREPLERRNTAAIDSLVCEIGALPIIASSYNSRRSEGLSLSAVVLAAAGCTDIPTPLTDLRGAPAPLGSALPQRATARKLITHYLSHIYDRMPFFLPQGLWNQFELVYSEIEAGNTPVIWDDHDGQTPEGRSEKAISYVRTVNRGCAYFDVLIVMAIATSSLSRNADSIILSNSKEHFRLALRFAEYAILPNTVIGLQAVLFLVQYATLNPTELSVWYLIGVGMRICVDLGLHQDPPEGLSGINESLLETRRRLFWSTYSFDRSMSLSHSQPCEISNDVIRVGLPSFRIQSTASDDDILNYTQRYRILQLQSLIFDELYTPVNQLEPQLAAEKVSKLLEDVKIWNESNSSLTSLHSKQLMLSEWHQSLILLYRPCRLLRERPLEDLLLLWRSALQFARVYRKFVEKNEIFYISMASEKVFTAGIALFYSFWKVNDLVLYQGQHGTEVVDVTLINLWNGIRDVNYILQTLSERWEDGKFVARRFEKIGEEAVSVLTGSSSSASTLSLPEEITQLWQHSSITSSIAMNREVCESRAVQASSDELDQGRQMRELALEIIRGHPIVR